MTPNAIELWRLVRGILNGYETRRRGFFESHIESLQGRMTAIHKDYTHGFEDIRRHLAEASKPSAAMIQFLRHRRREYEAERDVSRALARELRKARKLGVHGEGRKATQAYCRSVLHYLHAARLLVPRGIRIFSIP